MISTLFEYTGKILGETVHQTGKLVEATLDGTKSLADDIIEAPSAFMKGYEEELFTSNESTEDITQPAAKKFGTFNESQQVA